MRSFVLKIASASVSLGIRNSTFSTISGSRLTAGAGFNITLIPKSYALSIKYFIASKLISNCNTIISKLGFCFKKLSISFLSILSLAPLNTIISLSLFESCITANPVFPSFTSTEAVKPFLPRLFLASSPNISLPTAPKKTILSSRAFRITAWLAPLPPFFIL